MSNSCLLRPVQVPLRLLGYFLKMAGRLALIIVGFLVMIAGVAWTLARNLLSTRESRAIGLLILGTLAAYGCNGMFHDIMIIPMVHMFLFFLAGVAVTAYQSGLASERRQLPWRAFQTRPLQSS